MKVGDKVKVIKNLFINLKNVKTGKVVDFGDAYDFIGVEFDEHIVGHSCNGTGREGYCWYVPIVYLEVINDFEDIDIKDIKWYKR